MLYPSKPMASQVRHGNLSVIWINPSALFMHWRSIITTHRPHLSPVVTAWWSSEIRVNWWSWHVEWRIQWCFEKSFWLDQFVARRWMMWISFTQQALTYMCLNWLTSLCCLRNEWWNLWNWHIRTSPPWRLAVKLVCHIAGNYLFSIKFCFLNDALWCIYTSVNCIINALLSVWCQAITWTTYCQFGSYKQTWSWNLNQNKFLKNVNLKISAKW